MNTHPQHGGGEAVRQLRQQAGQWLKELRISRHLTQRQLAERVGINYYTFISQIEAGKGRVPPESYGLWASALEVEQSEFVRVLLRFYDPYTYDSLRRYFGADAPGAFDGVDPASRRAANDAVVASGDGGAE